MTATNQQTEKCPLCNSRMIDGMCQREREALTNIAKGAKDIKRRRT